MQAPQPEYKQKGPFIYSEAALTRYAKPSCVLCSYKMLTWSKLWIVKVFLEGHVASAQPIINGTIP